MGLTVSQVAKLAGVSVRTLHHYDELGLLRPSARSEAGYRLYDEGDLERLQQVLFFRELGFPLEDIRRILADPELDLRAALRMQRELLQQKAARTAELLSAVERTLAALDEGRTMTREERFEVFGDDDPTRYDAEAKERWGHTEAYRESQRRTARYGKEQWQAIKAEGEKLYAALGALLAAGKPPTGPEAMDLAEQHRRHIDRWFYPCSRPMHRGLGELYVADERFTAFFERIQPGLARFTQQAFAANADRTE